MLPSKGQGQVRAHNLGLKGSIGLNPGCRKESAEAMVEIRFESDSEAIAVDTLRERFIEKKGKNDRQMSVLPLHLPTYSKN